MPKKQKPPTPDDKISRQLRHMLASRDFTASPQQVALLNFVVNRTLAGKAHELEDFTIAVKVFGRGPEFDLRTDPIVGIQADMLRRAFERYYRTSGKNDPIRIGIPNGTYVPMFHRQKLNRS